MNEKMKILGSDRFLPIIGSGSFSAVFGDDAGNRIYKLFCTRKRYTEPSTSTAKRVLTFVSELKAHCKLKTHFGDNLPNYLPKFYGSCRVSEVINQDGNSLADEFFLDCCLAMEWIRGADAGDASLQKMRDYKEQDHVLKIERELAVHGVNYVGDASLFYPNDPLRVKIIDFAMDDVHGNSSLP